MFLIFVSSLLIHEFPSTDKYFLTYKKGILPSSSAKSKNRIEIASSCGTSVIINWYILISQTPFIWRTFLSIFFIIFSGFFFSAGQNWTQSVCRRDEFIQPFKIWWEGVVIISNYWSGRMERLFVVSFRALTTVWCTKAGVEWLRVADFNLIEHVPLCNGATEKKNSKISVERNLYSESESKSKSLNSLLPPIWFTAVHLSKKIFYNISVCRYVLLYTISHSVLQVANKLEASDTQLPVDRQIMPPTFGLRLCMLVCDKRSVSSWIAVLQISL